MRALIILAPALLLGACQVTEDKANGQTTVSYNQDVAENAGATALNTVDQAAGAIVNDTKEAAATARNRRCRRQGRYEQECSCQQQLNVSGFDRATAALYRTRQVGEWRSLVAHLVWDQRVAGSNPVSPTIIDFRTSGGTLANR